MLRIVQQQHAGAAKSYYRAGYYAEGGDGRGMWGGEGAGRLGLSGEVGWADLGALVDNRLPGGGGRWTPANVANRRCGYDVSWSVPKSVSVLYEWTLDPDVLAAFHAAVDAAMAALEQEARARARRGEGREHADDSRVTANLVWAKFVHRTTRPVGGVPDPHLHAHCFVFNGSFDPAEGRWKALDFSEAKRQGRFFEALFHAHLAGNLRQLGYAIEKKSGGRWEVAGVPPEVLARFSRRTELIERAARERGIVDPELKDQLGAATRERKSRVPLTPGELRAHWAGRLSAAEAESLDRVPRVRGPGPDLSRGLAIKAVAFALGHCLERRAVVAERTLVAEALRWGVGWTTVADVFAVLRSLEAKGAVLVRDHPGLPGQRGVTTAAVLDEERQLLLLARDGKGRCPPLAPDWSPDGTALTPEQARAVAHVLGTRDRVILVRGAAGVGKTTLLKEVTRHTPNVAVLAPSAQASRGVLRTEGFAAADTVARFLADGKWQAAARGGVVVVDEAGLVGTPTLVRLLGLTELLDARVVLVGDRRQHASVERGTALRQLETEVGLYPASVTRIQRQRGEYRRAVAALSRGDVGKGFRVLDALGWVTETPDVAERARLAAAAYHRLRAASQSVLVVAPTHAEGALVTAAIRAQAGLPGGVAALSLVGKGLTLAERGSAQSYAPGDVVEFRRSRWGARRHAVVEVTPGGVRLANGKPLWLAGAGGFEVYRPAEITLAAGDLVRVTRNCKAHGGHRLNNGAVYEVAAVDAARGTVTLGNGWRVPLDLGHLAHGYVSTSFAAQGRTTDAVILFQGVPSRGAAGPEQFYVSASRGREQCLVFTDCKAALARAASRSEPRVAATDLARAAAALGRDRRRRVWQSDPELCPSTPSPSPGRPPIKRSA